MADLPTIDLSVSSCIRPLRDPTRIQLRRRTRAATIKGIQVENPPQLINITAHIQPASKHELMRLPEGDRTKSAMNIWSQDELRTAQVSVDGLADQFVYQGSLYEILVTSDRTPHDNYYYGLALKVGQ